MEDDKNESKSEHLKLL